MKKDYELFNQLGRGAQVRRFFSKDFDFCIAASRDTMHFFHGQARCAAPLASVPPPRTYS
jgi:hypothetical protein